MKTIYLNIRTLQGIETVDEFTREKNQTFEEFNIYVNKMIKEYHVCNMGVYKSSRCTKDWKNKK